VPNLNIVPMFQWTPDYAVGIEEIDREHQQLFVLAEGMHRAMFDGRGKEFLQSLLRDLVQYTDYHFSHEERLMEGMDYPDLGAHRQQHQALKDKVRAMQERSASGEITMTIEVAHFLVAWLKQHTVASDRRLGPYLKAGRR